MKDVKNIYCGALLLLLGAFASCSDDGLNSDELKVYVNTGQQNQVELELIRTPAGAIGQSVVEFPLRSTRELKADAEVTLVADEALVESYNEANGTIYEPLSGDLYTLTPQITIREGEQISGQLVQVELTDPLKLAAAEGYILPVRLEHVASRDKGVELSTNLNTVYVIVTSTYKNVTMGESAPSGTLAEKTGWSVTATSTYGSYVASNMIDSSVQTSWFGYEGSVLTFDIGTEQTVNGIRLIPNYTAFSTRYYVSEAEIFISNDGEEWESQGRVSIGTTAGNVNNPDYKYINFYAPVKLRYFRLQVLTAPEYYCGLAEVDAYK